LHPITGEIETDYSPGVDRVNSPTAQALAALLRNAGPQHLALQRHLALAPAADMR